MNLGLVNPIDNERNEQKSFSDSDKKRRSKSSGSSKDDENQFAR